LKEKLEAIKPKAEEVLTRQKNGEDFEALIKNTVKIPEWKANSTRTDTPLLKQRIYKEF